MNALAFDQRDRLGRLHGGLEKSGASFRFSFGQYTGATPDHRNDSYRHAADVLSHRLSGELVLREEMRMAPPHILLTNFSMLEYQLLRPADSPLFDGPHGQTWTFLVLDEAHQYKGIRGAEMSLLLRRLKQRLRESGNRGSFQCIATSASLAGGDSDRGAVASFATNLFDEPFEAQDVILAETETSAPTHSLDVPANAYRQLREAIANNDPGLVRPFEPIQTKARNGDFPLTARIGQLLSCDPRVASLRHYMSKGPQEVDSVAEELFSDVDIKERTSALNAFTEVLNLAEQPHSSGPFLSVRYHLFLRALEGAFVRYAPEKAITLTPQDQADAEGKSFEIALCRECGQHYLVGREVDGYLTEAIRDPSRDDFAVSFFRPVDSSEGSGGDPGDNRFQLCVECGALWRNGSSPRCEHTRLIEVETQPTSNEHIDQMSECAACGYSGPDPVREVIHGGDGPNAMIATTLFERLVQEPKKILAFADSRQDAAYFAWYLDDTYRSVLQRNFLYRALANEWQRTHEPQSLVDIAEGYRRERVHAGLIDEAAAPGEQRRVAWETTYSGIPDARSSHLTCGCWPSKLVNAMAKHS